MLALPLRAGGGKAPWMCLRDRARRREGVHVTYLGEYVVVRCVRCRAMPLFFIGPPSLGQSQPARISKSQPQEASRPQPRPSSSFLALRCRLPVVSTTGSTSPPAASRATSGPVFGSGGALQRGTLARLKWIPGLRQVGQDQTASRQTRPVSQLATSPLQLFALPPDDHAAGQHTSLTSCLSLCALCHEKGFELVPLSAEEITGASRCCLLRTPSVFRGVRSGHLIR